MNYWRGIERVASFLKKLPLGLFPYCSILLTFVNKFRRIVRWIRSA